MSKSMIIWAQGRRTYSAAIWSPRHIVILKLEILVENSCVELDLAIDLVAELLPIRRGLRHVKHRVCGVSYRESLRTCGLQLALAVVRAQPRSEQKHPS